MIVIYSGKGRLAGPIKELAIAVAKREGPGAAFSREPSGSKGEDVYASDVRATVFQAVGLCG